MVGLIIATKSKFKNIIFILIWLIASLGLDNYSYAENLLEIYFGINSSSSKPRRLLIEKTLKFSKFELDGIRFLIIRGN